MLALSPLPFCKLNEVNPTLNQTLRKDLKVYVEENRTAIRPIHPFYLHSVVGVWENWFSNSRQYIVWHTTVTSITALFRMKERPSLAWHGWSRNVDDVQHQFFRMKPCFCELSNRLPELLKKRLGSLWSMVLEGRKWGHFSQNNAVIYIFRVILNFPHYGRGFCWSTVFERTLYAVMTVGGQTCVDKWRINPGFDKYRETNKEFWRLLLRPLWKPVMERVNKG